MNDRNKFNMMLDLAEFSAKRLEARRSVEFRMFISYMTLLLIVFYRFPVFSFDDISVLEKWLLIASAIGIHILYLSLQAGIAYANQNDATKRNYYSKIAESLSGHPIEYPPEYEPDKDNKISIIKPWYKFLFSRNATVLFKGHSAMFLVGIPTISFIILMFVLIKDFV